jgi:hypothetical protein
MCGIKQKLIPSLHKAVKCQQDKPQYNEKVLGDMAIVTKYRLQANSDKYVQDSS